jgi:hypothetical protein
MEIKKENIIYRNPKLFIRMELRLILKEKKTKIVKKPKKKLRRSNLTITRKIKKKMKKMLAATLIKCRYTIFLD